MTAQKLAIGNLRKREVDNIELLIPQEFYPAIVGTHELEKPEIGFILDIGGKNLYFIPMPYDMPALVVMSLEEHIRELPAEQERSAKEKKK